MNKKLILRFSTWNIITRKDYFMNSRILNRIHGRTFHKEPNAASSPSSSGFKLPLDDPSTLVDYIVSNTEVSDKHLTPEIKLHLITPNCSLWEAKEDEVYVPDPFWAFYWPGGQALTRYILDNPHIMQEKTVLDVGSGCGASAIASTIVGAKKAVANDICLVAAEAIRLNGYLNNVTIYVETDNLIGKVKSDWDIILVGDMFYDDDFTDIVSDWLKQLKEDDKTILIGDPGRLSFLNHPLKNMLTQVAKYELHPDTKLENNGLTHGYVWKFG